MPKYTFSYSDETYRDMLSWKGISKESINTIMQKALTAYLKTKIKKYAKTKN